MLPDNATLDSVLKLCAERRLPRLLDELTKAKSFHSAIIAGDFNEPSHLDFENRIQSPVSIEFEKNGFTDTFWEKSRRMKEKGFTWPAGSSYTGQPPQRIDMIYTKNCEVIDSVIYDGDNRFHWISDHKMVITDIRGTECSPNPLLFMDNDYWI